MFRQLGINDADAMALVHAQGFSTPWSADDFRTFLKTPTYLAFGVEEAEELLAFALFQTVPPEIELCTLVVQPSFRRRGLARNLINTCLSGALSGEVCYLEVSEDNKSATKLYLDLGFERFGYRPNYYKNTDGSFANALQMRKRLPARV